MRLQKLSSIKTKKATLRNANTITAKDGKVYTTGVMTMKDAKGKDVEYKFFEKGTFENGEIRVEQDGKYVNIYQ